MRQPLGVRPPDPLKVTAAQLARAQRWPIGQTVTVTKVDGVTVDATTRSMPFQSGLGHWSILVTGLNGGTPIARVVERCDHKFIDSTHCLKCGWTPPAPAAVGEASDRPGRPPRV